MDTSTWTEFGDKTMAGTAETVPVNMVLDDFEKYAGKHVRVCGQVRSVCAHRGCWLHLGGPTGEETVFVKFTCPVEGRLIPMEAVGHRAVAEGTLQVKAISVEELRHYEEEAGASAEELAKITAPQKQVTLLAPSAAVDLAGPKS